jgi:hypothetical protein
MLNIVTNPKIVAFFKKSRYYRVNLGLVSTIDKGGNRVYSDRDKFSYFYNTTYKTTIYGQGNIGDIMFHLDYYIKEDLLAVYKNSEEFIFEFDDKLMLEKGPDFYLGHILKELEEKHEARIKEAEEKQIETKRQADSTLLSKNPGAVTYEDVQEYLKKKQSERFSI